MIDDVDVVAEEISLGEPCFREDADIVVRKINFNYMQKSLLKSVTRRFQIFNDIYLFYMQRGNTSKRPKHRLDLTFIDPEPVYEWIIAWKLLVTGLVLMVLSLVLKSDLQLPLLAERPGAMFSLATLIGLAGAAFLLLAYHRSHLNLVFKTFAGHAPVLFITPKPFQKEYRRFIETLKQGIDMAQNRGQLSMKDRLAGEIKDLWRLKENRIITEQAYREAQAKILSNPAFI